MPWLSTWLGCGAAPVPPRVQTTDRWERVEALARTECDAWPEEAFPTDLAPDARRLALREWHAAHPDAVVDLDPRYVSFAYVDGTDLPDIPVIAHLVDALRRCGRWVDQRTEEDLVARACERDPAATAEALAAVPPPPPPQVWAAREATWVVDMEAPAVGGRFMATLMVGTQEWMAEWVLDREGRELPPVPENMPFRQLLHEETRAPEPGVPEMVARCTTSAPEGPFRVPAPGAAGVLRRGEDGVPRVWWPIDGAYGSEGPLGPLTVWTGEAKSGTLEIGELRRVEHCPGHAHLEAEVALGDAVVPGEPKELGILTAPHVERGVLRLDTSSACGPVLVGPRSTWALGCCDAG